MNEFFGTWINSIIALGMFILTLFYVVYTKKILFATIETVKQAEITRRENTKPDIIVYFDTDKLNVLNLIVKNIGKSVAFNVQINLEKTQGLIKEDYFRNIYFLNNPIPTFAPEQSIDSFCGLFRELKDENEKFPIFKVTVSYQDSEGNQFKNDYLLDLNMYKGILQIENKSVHDLTKEIGKMRNTLEKIERSIRKD